MQRLARYSCHLSFPRILDPVVLSLTRFLIVFVLEAVLLSRILENPCSPERPCLILPHHHLELRRPWNKIPCFLRMRLHCSPEKIVQGSKSSSFVAAEDGLVEVSGIVCWYASTWWAPMIQPRSSLSTKSWMQASSGLLEWMWQNLGQNMLWRWNFLVSAPLTFRWRWTMTGVKAISWFASF